MPTLSSPSPFFHLFVLAPIIRYFVPKSTMVETEGEGSFLSWPEVFRLHQPASHLDIRTGKIVLPHVINRIDFFLLFFF
ncbi:hypothetical protein LX32DRAFT_647277 [Colletotrichum zoysiae]|uniref:Uncharacterized protein n=1 Tax=Colletotrichum zoysiae TaxID=1216348 RepID=A0AAD9H1C9_9PEZI|nr:hypothetical protein LX32DRAFT_647277 [Colletotrichum zoysiae]